MTKKRIKTMTLIQDKQVKATAMEAIKAIDEYRNWQADKRKRYITMSLAVQELICSAWPLLKEKLASDGAGITLND